MDTDKKGVIYILKNPSFPNYVKIGYADDIEERLRQLNRSECIPFAFRVYATYEVDSRLMDLKVHSIIDKLNPNLRSVDTFNGQKRVREFYAMSAEDAYEIFEAIAEINGNLHKLKKWGLSEKDAQAEEMAEEVDQEQMVKRAPNYTFDFWKIPIGATLEYIDDSSIKCTVVGRRKLEYQGETMYMTPFAQIISGKKYLLNGPGYVGSHFKYQGELLDDIAARLHVGKVE